MNDRRIGILTVAQWLVIASLISLMTSPPLVNLFELLLFICVGFNRDLRSRVWRFLKSTAGLWTVSFTLMLLSAVLYGAAPRKEILESLFSWRRLLMLPVASALFRGQPTAKRHAAVAFFYASAAFVLYSFISYAMPSSFPWVVERGMVVRNHSTQGMFFATAIVVGIALMQISWNTVRSHVWVYGLIIVLLFLNISMIVTGRSGYVALFVGIGCYTLFNKNYKYSAAKISLTALSLIVITATLALSPVAKSKITQAIQEAQQADVDTENNVATSIGLRIMFWRNTLTIIPHHPIIGVGTGSFQHVYAQQVAGRSNLAGFVIGDPHNQYLKIIVEQGFLGIIIFIGLLIAVVRQKAIEPYRSLGLCVLLAWCTTSLANAHFSTFSEGHFIWCWIGLMLANDEA